MLKYGDSLLITFDSVEAALVQPMKCSWRRIGLTQRWPWNDRSISALVSAGQALIFGGHDIFGLEVNLASRLEKIPRGRGSPDDLGRS